MDKEKQDRFEEAQNQHKALSLETEIAPRFTRIVNQKHKLYQTKWAKESDPIKKEQLRRHEKSSSIWSQVLKPEEFIRRNNSSVVNFGLPPQASGGIGIKDDIKKQCTILSGDFLGLMKQKLKSHRNYERMISTKTVNHNKSGPIVMHRRTMIDIQMNFTKQGNILFPN